MQAQPPYGQLSVALADACARAGLDAEGATLLRLHGNGVFYLPRADTVARISSGEHAPENVRTSVCVTDWLARSDFPTVRPRILEVVEHEGLVVSFWVYVKTLPGVRSSTALPMMLHRLHSLASPPFSLPAMADPLTGVKCAITDHPEAFDEDDQEWLADAVSASQRRWREFDFHLPMGLIHGDAHPHNVLYTPHGALLGDWDHVSNGPREWDLVQSLYFDRRFPAVGTDPQMLAQAYGWDLRNWPEADELIAVREISGLGAYARTAAFKPSARAELAYRIQTLRQNDTLATWNSPSSL
jgi:hypothetical protein